MAKLPGLPLDASLLRPGLWVAEVVYFPLETALLQAARAAGCPVLTVPAASRRPDSRHAPTLRQP